MTVMRPIVNIYSTTTKNKQSDFRSHQQSADNFWRWAEGRISFHMDAVCENGVRAISDASCSVDVMDSRMKVIITQSGQTPDQWSPFDRLASAITRGGAAPVRIKGSSKLTMDCVESDILMGALGVTTGLVSSDQCSYSISLKGLDLSILEDIVVVKHLVVIIESADSIERDILNRTIRLVHSIQSCYISSCIVLDSNLGEPLVEDVIDDECLFANLVITKIPLIDSRKLRRRIDSIFYGPIAEIHLLGLPMVLPDKDFDFIRNDLIEMTISPLDLCSNILLSVANWFKLCPLSFLVGEVVTSADPLSTLKQLAKDIRECLGSPKQEDVAGTMGDLLGTKRSLAIAGRVLEAVAASFELLPSDIASVAEVTKVRFSNEQTSALIKRVVVELQSKKGSKRSSQEVCEEAVLQLERLRRDLRKLGVQGPEMDRLDDFIENIRPRAWNQKKLLEDFFKHYEDFLKSTVRSAGNGPLSETTYKSLHTKATPHLDQVQADADPFSATLEFLRSKATRRTSLDELREGVKGVFGGRGPSHQCIDIDTLKSRFEKVNKTGKSKDNFLDLAESLGAMELLGLIKPPATSDFLVLSNSVKVRRNYKDTWLVAGQSKEEDSDGN